MSILKSSVAIAGSAGASVVAALICGLFTPAPRALAAGPAPGPIAAAIPGQSGYGTIKGRVVWGGSTVPKPEALVANKDPQVCGKVKIFDRSLVVDPASKGIAHAFVYINGPKGKNAEAEKALLEKAPEVVIDQKNCEFLPYTTAAHKGQKFLFKSSDATGHNARYTGFTNGAKNVALPPNGQAEAKLAAEKRPLTLNCDIHPWMTGYIMVFDHPFFTVTGEDGSFEIKGVPAGPQKLVAWVSKVGYVTPGAAAGQAITVKPGEVIDLGDIVLDPSKVKDTAKPKS